MDLAGANARKWSLSGLPDEAAGRRKPLVRLDK
jgi:hypothetical protein